MLITALLSVAALAGSDPDGVVTTAPATPLTVTASDVMPEAASPTDAVRAQAVDPHGLTTDQQIERWISAREPVASTWVEPDGRPADDRKMHGEVSVSVGTGGYRQYGGSVSLPLGDSGRLGLSFSQTENSPWGYYDRIYDNAPFDYGRYSFPGAGSREVKALELESRIGRLGPLGPRDPEPARADW